MPVALPDLEALRGGGKAALARALAVVEQRPDDADVLDLLDRAYRAPKGRVIGLTGPPGVGKSTLTGALIKAFRDRGDSVGCIAVDPSSRRSGGALLGDRTRIETDPDDMDVFVRSMAARDQLGGLANLTISAMVLMRAVYDIVLIETVGVGQSETDVVGVADTVVFCVQPGSGDSLQFMKAGIAEIPHICVVTKADMGVPAKRAASDMEGALSLAAETGNDWQVPVKLVSVQYGDGIDGLLSALDAHLQFLNEKEILESTRRIQALNWFEEAVRERFGRDGLKRAAPLRLAPEETPFQGMDRVADQLTSA